MLETVNRAFDFKELAFSKCIVIGITIGRVKQRMCLRLRRNSLARVFCFVFEDEIVRRADCRVTKECR